MLREKNTPGVIKPGVCYVRERIRTPDTLVRSQVLYPAELRTRICCFSNSKINYTRPEQICQALFQKRGPLSPEPPSYSSLMTVRC